MECKRVNVKKRKAKEICGFWNVWCQDLLWNMRGRCRVSLIADWSSVESEFQLLAEAANLKCTALMTIQHLDKYRINTIVQYFCSVRYCLVFLSRPMISFHWFSPSLTKVPDKKADTFLHYSNMQWCKIIPYKKVQSLNVFVFQNNDFVPEPELWTAQRKRKCHWNTS